MDERPEEGDAGVTRRQALAKGAGAAAMVGGVGVLAGCGGGSSTGTSASTGASTSGTAPTGSSNKAVTLRCLGIGVDQNPVLKARAKKDLNIDLVYTITDTPTTGSKSIQGPQNFDVLQGFVHQVPQLWPANVFQPVDANKIKLWNGVAPVLTTGKLTPNPKCTYGEGDAAYRMLFLKPDDPSQFTGGKTAFDAALQQKIPTSNVLTGMPNVFNVDSIGYNKKFISKVDSWAELFNPQYKGKVALINDPQIGPADACMAAQYSGKLKFGNKGALTKQEIDNLTKLLIDMKKTGFFRAFWSTFNESVNLMSSGEVIIESMWSPAQTVLLEGGMKVGFAAPKEGFRGWCSNMMIFKHVSGDTLDAVYRYMNWWLSGFPGANMARQAYYSPRPDTARKFLSKAEWDYWYGGKPAATNLEGPDGKKAIPKGSVREGGSFTQRVCKYAVWNSTQPEADYMATQWNNFVSA
jgi:putative spermidine/putrescine transport system substrate-binding protein